MRTTAYRTGWRGSEEEGRQGSGSPEETEALRLKQSKKPRASRRGCQAEVTDPRGMNLLQKLDYTVSRKSAFPLWSKVSKTMMKILHVEQSSQSSMSLCMRAFPEEKRMVFSATREGTHSSVCNGLSEYFSTGEQCLPLLPLSESWAKYARRSSVPEGFIAS